MKLIARGAISPGFYHFPPPTMFRLEEYGLWQSYILTESIKRAFS